MGRVDGKVILITGAASGLGEADARLLAAEGAKVVLTDVDYRRGETAAASIPGAHFLEHDVRDETRWREVIQTTVDMFGSLDVLVNNAGIVRFGGIEACTVDDFRLHYQVMVEGTFLGCKHCIPVMAQRGGGSIINISSIGGLKGVGSEIAYSAAKAAIVGLTRSIAVDCQEQGYGIRLNVVAPGGHDTPMTRKAIAELPDDCPEVLSAIKAGLGSANDVANLVLFLASEESRHINGTVMVIDGGEMMR